MLRMRSVRFFLRYVFLMGALAVLPAMLAAHAALANDSQKEINTHAEALLAKSRDLSNIEGPGNPAFVLNAKIHFQMGTQSAEGEAQILWTAPDHYRVAYTAPNYGYVEIARDGYRYRVRTNNEMPIFIFELQRAFAAAIHDSAYPEQKIKRAEVTQAGNEPLTCITFGSRAVIRDCLDSSGDLVTREIEPLRAVPAPNAHYEFSDFVAFGAKRFPQKVIFRGGEGHVIEIDVQRLAFVKEVAADAFRIPTGAMQEPWCAEPQTSRVWLTPVFAQNDPRDVVEASIALANAKATLYCVIAPTGRLRSATVMQASKPVKDEDLRTWMKGAAFRTQLCGKLGVEYEVEVTFIR